MKLRIKYQPTTAVSLEKMLKRRKMSLATFLTEQGISTYESLRARCATIGIVPPSEEEFLQVSGPIVSNPQEGVVILEPIPIINDATGREAEEIAPPPTPADIAGIKSNEDEKPRKKRGGFQRQLLTDSVEVPERADVIDAFMTGSILPTT
jgi:hypothetical protein